MLEHGWTGAIGLAGRWVVAVTGDQPALSWVVIGGVAIALLVGWLWWRQRRPSATRGGAGRSGSGLDRVIDALPLDSDRVIEAVGEVAETVVNEAIKELAEVASREVRDWIEEKTAEPEPIVAESGNFAAIFDAVEAAIESGGAIESNSSSDSSSSDSGSDSSWNSSDNSSDYSSSSSDYSSSDSSSDSGWSSSD